MTQKKFTDEEKRRIEEEFNRIRAKLDSPEGQAAAEAEVNKELREAANRHREFLARSWARAHTRVVYR